MDEARTLAQEAENENRNNKEPLEDDSIDLGRVGTSAMTINDLARLAGLK
jgi:hypothetical protein